MRTAFIQELESAAAKNPKLALVVGDLGYSVVETFASKYPNQFFNAGVAEQNMMGLAAGLASEGWHVFVYSIANFPTFRCAEQIRNDVAYHNLPVTIVAVGGGLAYGNLGYSHHAVQDYALMRVMPNMLIASPGDPLETKAVVRYLVKNPGPSYLRLGKAGEPCIHKDIPVLEPGKWFCIKPSSFEGGSVFLSTGSTMELITKILSTREDLKTFGHFSLPLWAMNYKSKQVEQVQKFSRVITVEDHLEDAGFGSWLLESVSRYSGLVGRIKIKGLNPAVCDVVAKQKTLNEIGGLNESYLCE